MKIFSLNLSKFISNTTKIRVYELCKNGDSVFEAFVHEIEKDGNLFYNLADRHEARKTVLKLNISLK